MKKKFDRAQANKVREVIGKKAVNASKKYKHLFLNWFTGTGKTKASLDIMNTHKDAPWMIVIKEHNHRITWEEEIAKWGRNLDDFEFVTYNSLHKLDPNKQWNFCFDEAHAITALKRDHILKLNFNRMLYLTATMTAQKIFLLTGIGNAKKENLGKYTIDMAKSIELGLLPEPEIVFVLCNLPQKTMRKYKALSNEIFKAMLDNDEDKAGKLGLLRKQVVAKGKTAVVKDFLDFSKRFVCFTGTIEQCNALGGVHAIHSKAGKREDNIATIKKFNEKKIHNLFAVNMLRESMNLVDIDLGYLIQMDKTPRATFQIMGRSFRSDEPKLYVFLAKATDDLKTAKSVFYSVPNKYITYMDIDPGKRKSSIKVNLSDF